MVVVVEVGASLCTAFALITNSGIIGHLLMPIFTPKGYFYPVRVIF